MRKILLTIILCLAVFADGFTQDIIDGDTIYVYTNTRESAAVYDLSELKKITFGSQGILLWNTLWPTEYPYGNVRVISFRKRAIDASTGIGSLPDGNWKVHIGYNSSETLVTVTCGVELEGVVIYDLHGLPVCFDYNKRSVYNISLKHVPQGVYVVKAFRSQDEAVKKIVKQ